jgi:hypothetical protein
MKKINYLPYFVFAALLFSACSNHVYGPALFHQDIAYQPKPASFDSAKTANYASVGFGVNADPTFFDDLLYSAQFNVSRAHNLGNFNLAYGAFSVLGDYANSSVRNGDPNYFSDKFFGVLGGRASANFFVSTGSADFRILGIEAAYSHEFGDYANFRKRLTAQANQPDYYINPNTDLFTAGLSTEVTWRGLFNRHVKHGIRLFAGHTFGDNNYYNTVTHIPYNTDSQPFNNIFVKASYFAEFNRYIATIEAGNGILLRFGFRF